MTLAPDFIPAPYKNEVDHGAFEWSAPSNIALVKYWGKKPHQIPANPSLSFTLNNCKTITKLKFEKKESTETYSFDLIFEGKSKDEFKPKIEKLFERVLEYLPFLTQYHFIIETENTFPHSSGIASSASAMAALAINFMSIERLLNPEMTDEYFYEKASFISRLGSGSACRSIKGSIVVWGEHPVIPGSTDLFGIEYEKEVHPIFKHYEDTILLVDKGEKPVSSTAGHQLMDNHSYASSRFAQASANITMLDLILQSGDLHAFMNLVESEALTLHAMMMTSNPYYILMKPNTIEIINRIWNYRRETNVPICFTLDAGANVHVLYPENVKQRAIAFIKDELAQFCKNGEFIMDDVGKGAVLIDNE